MKRYALLIIMIVSTIMRPHNIQPLHANSPVIRYVATIGNDGGGCTSPITPCRTIQYAVNQSSPGDTILVAQGIYTYTGSSECSFLRTQPVICIIDKSLTIRGGYSNSNWTHSDPIQNPTVIDGGNSYRGVAVVGYNNKNTYLEMTGLTIQNCHVRGPTYSNTTDFFSIGGGMLSLHAAVILRDVVFRNNKIYGPSTNTGIGGAAYGAALYIYKPSPESVSSLKRVVFDANESYGGNGGDRGGVAFGALFVDNAKVVVEDSIFTSNVAQAGNASGSGRGGNPPEADALGGGIGIQDSDVVLRRVTITNNRVVGGNAQQYGGGAYGGGVFIEDLSGDTPAIQVYISDSYVAGNIAVGGNGVVDGGIAIGGGICAANSIVTIERTHIISNSAGGGNGGNAGLGVGGGIYTSAIRQNTGALTVLRNLIVADNFANQGTGNMRLDSGGGGVAIHGMSADLTHVTVAQNRLGNHLFLGQALLVQPWPNPQLPAVVELKRSIIADHTSGASNATAVVVEQGSTLNLDGVIFANNNHNININAVPVIPGIINGLQTTVTVPSAGFISPGAPNHNYHLRLDSPALDRSGQTIVSDDIDRQSRPYGNNSDFGADEYHPFQLTFVPGDTVIRLDWSAGSRVLQGGVGHYMLHLVSCAEGANPPQEVGCGQALNVGNSSSFTLTGLTNFKRYIVEIQAYDPTGSLIAVSERVAAFPTTIFVFLPVVLK